MPITQVIEFRCDNIDEPLRLDHEYLAAMSPEDRQKLFDRGQTIADLDDPGHYFVILEWESLELALAARDIPASVKLMEDTAPYVSGELKFMNCEVLSSDIKPQLD